MSSLRKSFKPSASGCSRPNGPTREGPKRGDDPAAANLVFTYTGPEPIAGPDLLQGFTARSISGTPKAVRGFDGRSTRATGPAAGSKVSSSGDVRGPGSVPEPASLLSACLGVIILGIVYAHRHRSMLHVAD